MVLEMPFRRSKLINNHPGSPRIRIHKSDFSTNTNQYPVPHYVTLRPYRLLSVGQLLNIRLNPVFSLFNKKIPIYLLFFVLI